MWSRSLCLAAGILAATSSASFADDCADPSAPCPVDERLDMAGIDTPAEARDFLSHLQEATRSKDREALAAMMRYPLNVYGPDGARTYADRDAFQAAFDDIFTDGVQTAIEDASYGALFIRDQGAMIGNGEVWFDKSDDEILVKTINPPG
ncbi:hypothetical protein J2R99_000178 [Rhodopseudomonas julia]|uniref:SnoaL-like domain-containing protein n=1 Tax=Rhodopseudomonas julia TaxID=200617 RepID=A0ABU0C1D4_9BRAD|nr:hypothetical protein [Rhodopseudomonas julia]MDQ0324329.1 hypothetical protein [Rhodopseudomonas julia]